jgi:hypothetical protein
MTMNDLAPAALHIEPRLPYLVDGPGSAILGVILIVAAAPLTSLAGWSLPPAFLLIVGVLLLPWAAFNLFLGKAARPTAGLIWANVAADGAWVLGSLMLAAIYWNELSPWGAALLLGQALAVAGMFTAKLLGTRTLLG